MFESREQLLMNNKFIVTLNLGVFSFAKISNLTNSIELETVQEGGYNESPRFFPKPKDKVETLILERGLQKSPISGDLLLRIGMPINAATIIVLNNGGVARSYGFEYGLITKWDIGELDGMRKDIVIRKLEISHTGLFEL